MQTIPQDTDREERISMEVNIDFYGPEEQAGSASIIKPKRLFPSHFQLLVFLRIKHPRFARVIKEDFEDGFLRSLRARCAGQNTMERSLYRGSFFTSEAC